VATTIVLDPEAWAETNFGSCELGDNRRTNRAVTLASQIAAHPDGSTPDQTETWSDLKAAYRLFDEDDVTFQALCEPHWKLTRSRTGGVWLIIGDTTEIDFTHHRETEGLGPIGNGRGHGFLLHSALMVGADTDEIVGLAGAELFHRNPARQGESTHQRKQRPRESEVWGRVIDLVGPPADETRFVHVLDAGADNYEVYCHLLSQRAGWVVRAAQHHRVVVDDSGRCVALDELLTAQAVEGTYELSLRARQGQKARTAKVEVRFAPVTMPRPHSISPWVRRHGAQSIPMWVVEVREIGARKGVEPLHWVLLTSEPVRTFEDAWRIIGWYEKRFLVEEYHKCLKTGCRVEERQYTTSDRLERVTGMLSIVAVRLLQLKSMARTEPERPADEVVPRRWTQALTAVRKKGKPIQTVRDFFRALAGLGGFLGRKGDGEPGWITIWRGLDKLILCMRGAEALAKKCG
jgi:hypothetical protein